MKNRKKYEHAQRKKAIKERKNRKETTVPQDLKETCRVRITRRPAHMQPERISQQRERRHTQH